MNSTVVLTPQSKPKRRDHRKATLAIIVTATFVLGYLIHLMPGKGVSAERVTNEQVKTDAFASLQMADVTDVRENKETPVENVSATSTEQDEVTMVLNQAQAELDAKRYDSAIATLQSSHQQLQQEPQAFLKMGQALEGKSEYNIARDFYNKATDMDPYLADGYWGFATTSEALGDLESALGAMRNYLHVQPNADPEMLKVAQARSAIWEWESKLGRGPWGPTKGVPPDLTAEEIKRDGRGVATKVPLLETKTPDGRMKYEIKHGEKKEIFKQ